MSIDLYSTYQSTSCHLYYQPDKKVFVNFPKGLDGEAEFSKEQELFKKAMDESGISIPIDQKKDFPELEKRKRSVIYLSDKSFGKAFINFSYVQMDSNKFIWQKN